MEVTQPKSGSGAKRHSGDEPEVQQPDLPTDPVDHINSTPTKSKHHSIHPLLINHILSEIFDYIILADLKCIREIRTVCKVWNEVATEKYRKFLRPVTIDNTNYMTYCNIMRASKIIPVDSYIISSPFFQTRKITPLNQFLKLCNDVVVGLEIKFSNDYLMNVTERSLRQIKLPKLQKLSFTWDNYILGSVTNHLPKITILMEKVLLAAINLNRFEYKLEYPEARVDNETMDRINSFICKNLSGKVKALKIETKLNNSHLRLLSGANLNLQEIDISCSDDIDSTVLVNLLELHKTTLKKLSIFCNNDTFDILFPHLPELVHLTANISKIEPLMYSSVLPKLTTIDVSDCRNEIAVRNIITCSNEHSKAVDEMYLPHRFKQAHFIIAISSSFTNITKLHLGASYDIGAALQTVFKKLNRLQELYVNFPLLVDRHINLDTILTAVPVDTLKRITEEKQDFKHINIVNVREERVPYISRLTDLRKLVLHDSMCSIILSDFAVRFAFLEMKSLREIQTSRYQMSYESICELRKTVNLKLREDEIFDYESDSEDGWETVTDFCVPGNNDIIEIPVPSKYRKPAFLII